MASHFTRLDTVVLVLYFLLVLGLGFIFWRRTRTVDGFTAGNRSLPGWVCGLSILATYLSSITFLALPGKAFAGNWNAFAFSLSLPLAAWIAARFFVPFYRRSGEVSAYSHLERRFGPWARLYVGIFYLLTQIARMGTVMYVMALPMSLLLDWDIRWVILLTGLGVTLYSFVGGVVAVIWNDAMQAIVLTVGAISCAGLLLWGLPDGVGQMAKVAGEHQKFSLGSFGTSMAESTFWVVLIYGLVINLQNFGIDQNYMQRYIASKSDREARKSLWLGALSYLPLSALFFFIGTALFVFYQVFPERLADDLRAPGKADSVFPYFIVTQLPPGATGLVIAAIFAAAMSTVSTSLNSSATLLMTDVYRRYFRPDANDKESMRVLYGSTVVWGLLGTGMALVLTRVDSLLDAWWTLSGILGGGMLGLFLLGLICKRAGNAAALAGVGAGLALIVWMTFSPKLEGTWAKFRSPFDSLLIAVFGTLIILLVGMLAGFFNPRAESVRASNPSVRPPSE